MLFTFDIPDVSVTLLILKTTCHTPKCLLMSPQEWSVCFEITNTRDAGHQCTPQRRPICIPHRNLSPNIFDLIQHVRKRA